MAHIGRDQLAIFSVTIIATLCTDLLWGIGAGVVAKFFHNMWLYRSAMAGCATDTRAPSVLQTAMDFFRNPVSHREWKGDEYHFYLGRPLVCFNSPKLIAELERVPQSVRSVVVHIGDVVGLVDHTSCENLMQVVEDFAEGDHPVSVVGLDAMRACSGYEKGTHVKTAVATRA